MDEINERWYNKEDEEEVKSEYSFTEYDIKKQIDEIFE